MRVDWDDFIQYGSRKSAMPLLYMIWEEGFQFFVRTISVHRSSVVDINPP